MNKFLKGDGEAAPPGAAALDSRGAIIHTSTVDVAIMRLGKRQLTLSTFRQLDEESVFLADGSLRGTPWGRVNYVWKGCRNGAGFHVVWENGGRLRRCAVPANLDWCINQQIVGLVETRFLDYLYDGGRFLPVEGQYTMIERQEPHRAEVWGTVATHRTVEELHPVLERFRQRVEEMGRLTQLFIAV